MNTISPVKKKQIGIMPFLTFPLTKKCNFKCEYCGYGGELSASMVETQEFNVLCERIIASYKEGVRKFRFTGGEPFLFPQIKDLLMFMNDLSIYTLINTNGSLVSKYKDVLYPLQDNIHFAVSLDSLNASTFSKMSGTKEMFKKVLEGIEILVDTKRLLRLNMVVTSYNINEVEKVIEYCQKLKCNLKLLDVVSVPLPYGKREDIHVSFVELEEKFLKNCDSYKEHQYARSFGTPCKIYNFSGVEVTVKSTWNGSHYDVDGICTNCSYFPCHEGLYDIFSLPDKRIVGCRWCEESVVNKSENFVENLTEMSSIFQRADYVSRNTNFAMKPEPDFVINSLRKAKEINNE